MLLTRLQTRQVTGLWLACCSLVAFAASGLAAHGQTAKQIVQTMSANERTAAEHRGRFLYLSRERSERTHGQLWTERVVETTTGPVRELIAVNGVSLTEDKVKQEQDRLANDAAHPAEMTKRAITEQDDENHARQMLELLGRGFLLENLHEEGPDWRIDFRPDPAYSPATNEEKILHGMAGYVLVDRKAMRLHHVEGRLPADVSIGFGLLATVKAGSNFNTTKQEFDGQWRTVRTFTDIRGKAALFKSIARNQDVTRTDFRRVRDDLSPTQAVALAESPIIPVAGSH